MADQMQPAPIIIFGAARSGTTYLTHLMNAHPEVFITDEIRLFAWAYHSLVKLTENPNLLRHHGGEFTRHLAETYPSLIRNFYRTLNPAVRYWGDKNPHYAAPGQRGCLPTIHRLFPAAQFIHLIRDGRDVVASRLRSSQEDFDAAHEMWLSHVAIGREFGQGLPSSQYFELRYEDLIQDDLAMAQELFNFLGLAMDPAVEAFCEKQRSERTPFCEPTRDISRGITKSDWASMLSEEQQAASLAKLGQQLDDLGYQPTLGVYRGPAPTIPDRSEKPAEATVATPPAATPEPTAPPRSGTIKILAVDQAPLDSRLRGFNIDRPATNGDIGIYALPVSGWVAGREGQPVAVEILDQSRLLASCTVNGPRPDVSGDRPGTDPNCGFGTFVSLLGMPADFEIEVRVVMADGERIPLGRITGRREPIRCGYDPFIQPIMLTSLGRCGTTWLMRLLAEDSRVVMYPHHPYEMRLGKYWMHMMRVLTRPADPAMPLSADEFNNELSVVGRNPFYLPPYIQEKHIRLWLGREYVTRMAQFCQSSTDSFYGRLAQAQSQPKVRYFAEKFHADALPDVVWELYPKAREVFLVRDFRDMACSILQFIAKREEAGFGREEKDSDEAFIRRMRHGALAIVEGWRRRASQAHLVRYEDLVRYPAETLAGIMEYLDLEVNPSELEARLSRACEDTPELQKHRTASTLEASVGRWQQDLDPSLQKVCQETFGEALAAFGYAAPPEQPQPLAGEPTVQEVVLQHVPDGATVAVISKGDDRLMHCSGRRGWHFPRTEDGRYAGYHPADSAEAIAMVREVREKGAEFLVIPGTSLWWLDHYKEFALHLRQDHRELFSDAHCAIYSLEAKSRS